MMLWRLPLATVLSVLAILEASPAHAFYSSSRKLELRELARDTWLHAYSQYKRVAFPGDEVLPLSCGAQSYDHAHPENGAVNDVMGDYALTLVDSMDSFPILGDKAGFEQAVRETIQHVNFDKPVRIQTFEVTIRVLGGLLSGHQLASNSSKHGYSLPWYNGELLSLAHDLGRRLLPAFNTPTGLPFARVHLQHGVRKGDTGETCAAGAGSLLLEMATLSRLTGDPTFEEVARRSFYGVWNRKSDLSLVGNTIDAKTGAWMHGVSSTGAGIDSIFEYAAKAHVMLGEDEWYRVWDEMYTSILRHVRSPDGFWYRGVNMHTGQLASVIVDSLSAFFPGVQALMGDLESAIKSHAVYAFQWKRYGGLPEMFDIHKRQAVHLGYPLRPELIESTLYLHQATKDDFYLEFAEQVLHDINNRSRVECGLAAVLDLGSGVLEDKQPSFATAETLKYLFLIFDEDNPFNKDDGPTVFTTEGHMLEVDTRPVLGRRKRSIPAEAPTCPAWHPESTEKHQHFLSQSVGRRIDFEYARYLAGFEILDESKEIEEGRWSENGWCEVGQSEEYGIELLFAASTDSENAAPTREQARQGHDGSVIVGAIAGLRFALTRAQAGGDGFFVSRVGPYRVAAGSHVHIHDPAVLAALPSKRVEKVQLDVQLGNSRLHLPAYMSSFGPSVASTSPPRGSFAFAEPALPLVQATFPFGCEPHHSSDPLEANIEGKILVLHRGRCSFAKKANLAALGGAKAVVLINSSDEEGFVPSAEGEEDYKALVPLMLVSNSTGSALEALIAKGGAEVALMRPVEANDEVDTLVLGGYQVLNVKLQRR